MVITIKQVAAALAALGIAAGIWIQSHESFTTLAGADIKIVVDAGHGAFG